MDIIESYKQAREKYIGEGYAKRKAIFDGIINNDISELERIATFAATSIATDDYTQFLAGYHIADLDMLEILHKEKGILHKDEALSAIYHLIEDYLKPESQQVYRFGPHLRTVLNFIPALGLEVDCDLTYLDRAIQKANDDGHYTEAGKWQRLRDKIAAVKKGK